MISVLMPAYNASRFIAEAIDSILNQTYKDFELIIVNDGSSDDTADVIERYAQQDERVRIIHKENGGISSALNAGLEIARHPWIARMDADDISLPHRLERQLEVAQADPEVVVWGSYARQINTAGEDIGKITFASTSKEEYHELRRRAEPVRLIHPTALLKRDIALKVNGYDSRLDGVEDSDMWWRMSKYGPIVNIPEYLILYRIHGSSVTVQKSFLQGEAACKHAFIRARYDAWVQGKELEYDEFKTAYNNRSWWEKFQERQHNMSFYYFRLFVAQFSERKYLASLPFFTMSLLNNPFYIARKMKGRLLPS